MNNRRQEDQRLIHLEERFEILCKENASSHKIVTDKLGENITLLTRMESGFKNLGIIVENHEHFINGDGSDFNPGAKLRIDRHEQGAKKRAKLHMAGYAAIVGLLIQQIFSYLT